MLELLINHESNQLSCLYIYLHNGKQAGLTEIVGFLKRACPNKIVIDKSTSRQYGVMCDVKCEMDDV